MAQPPSRWLREPDGFKDLKFGDSMKVAQLKADSRYQASGEFTLLCLPTVDQCTDSINVGDEKAAEMGNEKAEVIFIFERDRMVRVMGRFLKENYENALKLFATRYGRATTVSSLSSSSWVGDKVQMRITHGPSDDDNAYFTIELIAVARADAKSKAEKDAASKKKETSRW